MIRANLMMMHKLTACATMIFLIICMSIFACLTFAEDNAANSATIRGEVLEATEHQTPIQGATVKVVASSNGKTWTTLTDENGEYKLSGLPAGRWTINVSKKGYRSRVGSPKVLAAGGEIYARMKLIKNDKIQQNRTKIDLIKIEGLLQRVAENIQERYKLDKTTTDALRQSIMDVVSYELDQESPNTNWFSRASVSGNFELLELLLSHPNTQAAFAKHLTKEQLQDYIDSTKAQRQRGTKASVRFITAFLDQALTLTPEQSETIIQLIFARVQNETDYDLMRILATSLQYEGANVLNVLMESDDSLNDILTEEQLQVCHGWIELEENIHDSGMEDLIFEKAEAGNDKQFDKFSGFTGMHKERLLKLAQVVLIAHRAQFGTFSEQQSQRLELVAKGVAQQYIDMQIEYTNKKIFAMETFSDLMFSVTNETISRLNAIEKLNKLRRNLWDETSISKPDTENSEVDISSIRPVGSNHPFFQHILKYTFFERISEIINHPLYQKAIKDVLSEQTAAQYNKSMTERHAFHQQASQELVVALFDTFLLLDDSQRELIEKTVAKLTFPAMNGVGIQYMFLECFFKIDPEILTSWQMNVFKTGGL